MSGSFLSGFFATMLDTGSIYEVFIKSVRRIIMENILQEKRCIKIFYKTLREFQISERYFSIGGYAEEAICLQKVESGWMIYEGERGGKYNSKIHVGCEAACCDMLSRLADSTEAEKKWIDFFRKKYKSGFRK